MRKLFHNLAISGHGNERRPAQVLVEGETIGAVLDPGEAVAADGGETFSDEPSGRFIKRGGDS